MNREKTLDSIPIDLLLEIFSRLPAKSVGRSSCVSKQWASILGSQGFAELFLTRSSTRPRLLFALQPYNDGDWLFYSSPHPQNPYEKFTVVAADFHTKFPRSQSKCIYASGLFYFPDVRISKNKGEDPVPVICNPITGQYTVLPKLRTEREPISFFGFDPIEKQFKVLLIHTVVNNETVHHILTLGAGKMRWRNIQCPLARYPAREGICINGVLYYLANYKGKLCGISLKFENDRGWHIGWRSGWSTRELHMWILEDVEKQEWSQYVYPFPENGYSKRLAVVGMTTTGEIVLSENLSSKPYNVFYFSPEKNTFQCVNFQYVGANLEEHRHSGTVYAFGDHVEDLSVKDAKQLKSSVFDRRNLGSFESINKFNALCRLGDD
ncbi:F-box associated domain type 3 [Arabidopsis suecica]|uniref:F-box associated domain type 3 n=1 Tax=Arabidopsis suecica TaxID=45249 RepID=A0A8T2CPL2_ARASU|nr:F-box associated domain type 3 [Arabidopsis suecica]